jgi:serine/threonine protein kinase
MTDIFIGGKKLAEGGYGCVFHPEINCRGLETGNMQYVSKIQQKDFSAENEIKIGEIIKQGVKNMPGNPLINNFAPVLSSCPINMSQLKVPDIGECKVLHRVDQSNLILLKIRFIDSVDFDSYVIDNKNTSAILLTLISAFNHLLKSIKILQKVKVVQFDLKGQNIVFDTKKLQPIIIDFGLSLPMESITNDNLLNYFYIYAPEYYVWPLEVHYLNLILHISEEPTRDEIKDLVQSYVRANAALDGFSASFKKDFENSCEEQLLYYNTLTLTERKNLILRFWNTWDNYSLSVIYLKFIYFIIRSNDKSIFKNSFVRYFAELLLMNIHPDPRRRFTIDKTIIMFNKYLYSNPINKPEAFQDLSESLSKNKIQVNRSLTLNRRKIKTLTEKSIRAFHGRSMSQ